MTDKETDSADEKTVPDDYVPPAKDAVTGLFLPGNAGGPGRPKGSHSKRMEALNSVRDMFLVAVKECGGLDFVKQAAMADPIKFLGIVSKLLPQYQHTMHGVDDSIAEVEGVTFTLNISNERGEVEEIGTVNAPISFDDARRIAAEMGVLREEPTKEEYQ